MKISPDNIECSVIAALRGIEAKSESISQTDVAWTREVKNAVAALGRNQGYSVYASSCDTADDGEWLFDLTWMKYDPDGYMRRLPLVLESEWTPIEVLDDFCKLVVARAEHRVMVFWANSEKSADKVIAKLVDEAANSGLARPGDRYLFAVWLEQEDCFFFRLYVVGDGITTA